MALISPLRLKILQLIVEQPGITQTQIAQALYGRPYHQSVGAECRHLVTSRMAHVVGRGSAQSPFRYSANAEFRCSGLADDEAEPGLADQPDEPASNVRQA